MKAEIYYSSFSILESIWVALKLMRRSKLDHERFRLGLRSLIETDRYTRIVENTEAFTHALRLYILGHLDVIDNILYANSIQFNLKFLTTDEELRKFIRKRKLKDTTLTPNNNGLYNKSLLGAYPQLGLCFYMRFLICNIT